MFQMGEEDMISGWSALVMQGHAVFTESDPFLHPRQIWSTFECPCSSLMTRLLWSGRAPHMYAATPPVIRVAGLAGTAAPNRVAAAMPPVRCFFVGSLHYNRIS